jgi:hypothetical protein
MEEGDRHRARFQIYTKKHQCRQTYLLSIDWAWKTADFYKSKNMDVWLLKDSSQNNKHLSLYGHYRMDDIEQV